MIVTGQAFSRAATRRRSLLRRLGRCRFYCDRAGAAIVEFALAAPVLILILAGIFDAGTMFYIQNNMLSVARETVRRLAVGDLANQSDAHAFASNLVVNWPATFTTSITEPDPNDPSDFDYVVEISVPMVDAALIDPLGVFNSGTLRAQAVMRKE